MINANLTCGALSATFDKLVEIVALGDDHISAVLDVEIEPGVCIGDLVYKLRDLVETLIGPSTLPVGL